MVHYRRKPYKRKQSYERERNSTTDLFDENGDDLFYDIDDESLLKDDEPVLFDEPDIVKELRQDEMEGKLSYPVFEDMEPFEQSKEYMNMMETYSEPTVIKNYDDALAMAKKALHDIEK